MRSHARRARDNAVRAKARTVRVDSGKEEAERGGERRYVTGIGAVSKGRDGPRSWRSTYKLIL